MSKGVGIALILYKYLKIYIVHTVVFIILLLACVYSQTQHIIVDITR
jgi:hypothetical protein